jgi:prephenate dehydrogenase
MNTVAIVGAGLIGSSFGLALRAAGFEGRLIGVSSPDAVRAALERGAIDEAAPLAQAAAGADLIFLSQTIGRILDTLRHLDPLVRPDALVTDAGSTKCEITDVARQFLRRCRFLGGHPMAGKETRGAMGAEPDLFRDRPWVLTPDAPEDLETPGAREFTGWLDRMGARRVIMDADEHDRVVALTSHLPQLASTGLAATVGETIEDQRQVMIAGSGLADTTRLAASSYELWRDILATNTAHIEEALGAYIQMLEHMRENLRTRQLLEVFERGADVSRRIRRPG